MNNVILPRTFFSYWSIRGNFSFNPMNLPTKGDSIGVVIGGFDPAALHASPAVGDKMMATPPGILPLDPMVRYSWLCQISMCPRTKVLQYPKIQVSCMQ